MVSKVQRLGAGPWAVAAVCWRASSPGPWCKRSWSCCWSCWSRLKTAPTVAAVLVGQESGQSFVLVVVEPGVDRVGVAVFEQAGVGHGIRSVSIGDFEQGGTAFADVGFGIVVAV